jgi:phosphoribosylglycinamide formyltransferase 2
VQYEGVAEALALPESQLLLFGKSEARPGRRMGVALARGADAAEAQARADAAAAAVRVLTG